MIIEGSFYRLTPTSKASNYFDLELLYDIGGKNPRQEFKVEGYGYTLETALKKCCNYAVSKKFKDDEIIDLKTYMQEYKKVLNSLKKEFSDF